MTAQLFSALVSLACFSYARYLNSKSSEGLSEEEYRDRLNNITFFSLFGTTALFLSFF
jgi:hypothetical protein